MCNRFRRDSARITIRENLKNPGDQNGARAASISNYFPYPRFFRELVDAEESFTFALATLFLSPRQECASSVDQHARHPRFFVILSTFYLYHHHPPKSSRSIWSAKDAPSPLLLSLLTITLDWIFYSTLYQVDAHWISIHRGAAIPAVWYLPRSLCVSSRLLATLFHEESCKSQWEIHTHVTATCIV